MDKTTRHKIIKEIVSTRPVATQEELAKALLERGVNITQATVSRDIAEIPLQKVRTGAGLVYDWRGAAGEPASRLARMMRDFVVSVTRSENLVLLRTAAGLAAPVAICVDEAQLALVLGTIAGDDTILVVAKDKAAGARVRDELAKMLG